MCIGVIAATDVGELNHFGERWNFGRRWRPLALGKDGDAFEVSQNFNGWCVTLFGFGWRRLQTAVSLEDALPEPIEWLVTVTHHNVEAGTLGSGFLLWMKQKVMCVFRYSQAGRSGVARGRDGSTQHIFLGLEFTARCHPLVKDGPLLQHQQTGEAHGPLQDAFGGTALDRG